MARESVEDFDNQGPQADVELQKDLRLEMKVKNNILWKKIHEKFPTVAAFCRGHKALGLSQTQVGRLLAFKVSPFRYRGTKRDWTQVKIYRKDCLAIEKALGCPAEILFPEELYEKMLGRATNKSIEISSFSALPSPKKQQLLFLPAPDPSPSSQAELRELGEKLETVLKTLTYREREIIKLRHGIGDGFIYTLEVVARIFKISPNRVRQIEGKAINKLQHPVRSNQLKSFV